jgi:hypothetical protein
MKMASRTIVATLALITMMAAGGNFAQAQKKATPNSEPTADRVQVETPNVAKLQATADKAKASIQESTSEKQELVKAVRSKNEEQAKSLLLRNGFTEKQLEDARIELVDKTGGIGGNGGTGGAGGNATGGARDITITIHVECCPFLITITISL